MDVGRRESRAFGKLPRMLRGVDVERRVRAIVAQLAKQNDAAALPADADVYRRLGIASAGALELLLSLEEDLAVQLPDAEFNEARTIGALCSLVERRRAA